jgi:predicted metal-dependent peptidase
MDMTDDQKERAFKRKRIEIMRSKQFVELGPIMMMGSREFTRDIPTACTNGRDEKYNPDFIFQWTEKEAGFITLHENLHKAGRHLEVYDALHRLCAKTANAACDHWINLNIVAADPNEEIVAMPRDPEGNPIGLYDKRFEGMSVKKVFDILYDEKGDKEEDEGQDGEGSSGGFDDHDWDGAKGMTADEKDELKADIGTAIRQGLMAAKKAGKDTSGGSLGLGELLAPKVDWVEQMKHFVRATCAKATKASFARIDRRAWVTSRVVLPILRGHCVKELVVAPDVSGSMFFDNSFDVCMSEVEGLARQLEIAKIHLIYWDGSVCAHEEYTSSTFKNWRTLTKPHGGGGTDPTCVADYLREKKIEPDASIVLTDGEVMGWGRWDHPVLWGIHNTRNNITAPVGKTIQLERRV